MLGPVCAQVIRQAEVPASDRKFPALTDGSGTQRARRLRSRTAFDISPPWSSSSPSDYAFTSVFSCVARGFKGRLASFPQGAAGGSRWLLMAVRGHLGDMHRQCACQALSGLALPDDRWCSGQACRGA